MRERYALPIEAVFGASAHPPQAPIWLDPSGCPPGRVFRFGRYFELNRGMSGLLALDKIHVSHRIAPSLNSIRAVASAFVFLRAGLFMTHRADVALGTIC